MTELALIKETMSSIEIAELTGKPHNDVLKAIRAMEPAWAKIAGGNFSLSEYKDSTGRKLPMYELTKVECLYIATKFNDEARAKLVIRWEQLETEKQKPLSQIEILVQSANLLLEQEKRLGQVENKVLEIDARTKVRPDYFTIVGYATLKKIKCGLQLASSLGKKATSLCKSKGYQMEEIPDPRFGRVKTYPLSVLQEVFDMPVN